MPKYFIYVGREAKNIGRFGWVTPLTPLVLTDQESEGVKGNPEFRANKHPEKQADSQNVQKQNDGKVVEALEIQTGTRTQLLELAKQLKAEGKDLELSANPTLHELRRKLLGIHEAEVKAAAEPVEEAPTE